MAAIVDELENLGCVYPTDGRAKLSVPPNEAGDGCVGSGSAFSAADAAREPA
jgi:hypothetical protein